MRHVYHQDLVQKNDPFELLYGYKPPILFSTDERKTFDKHEMKTDDLLFARLSFIRKTLCKDEEEFRDNEIKKLTKGKPIHDLKAGDMVLRKIPEKLRNNKLDI
ncbi:hypothetical protein DMUE_3708 [Dictyocoela muelleri]|nr:hypothetical protein DMUE_3708 [Dictyocoela muelleri]